MLLTCLYKASYEWHEISSKAHFMINKAEVPIIGPYTAFVSFCRLVLSNIDSRVKVKGLVQRWDGRE